MSTTASDSRSSTHEEIRKAVLASGNKKAKNAMVLSDILALLAEDELNSK